MADLATIVRLHEAIIANSSNQNMCEVWIFSGFVTKTVELHLAKFSSLLQTSWVAEKEQILIPTGSWFCAECISILFMYFDADNINLTEKISLHRTYWLVFIGGDIDYFLPNKTSVSKYTSIVQIPSAQKSGAYWNESLRFFCCSAYLQ